MDAWDGERDASAVDCPVEIVALRGAFILAVDTRYVFSGFSPVKQFPDAMCSAACCNALNARTAEGIHVHRVTAKDAMPEMMAVTRKPACLLAYE